MRYGLLVLLTISCLLRAEDAAPASETPVDQLTLDASYAIGRDIGQKIGGVVQQYDLDRDRFLAGLQAVLDGQASEMDDAKMQEVLMAFQQRQQEVMAKRAEQERRDAPMRKEKNAAWLAENAKQEGVVVLPSGLQYKIVKSGDATGESPKMGDQVECHYTGTKIDGTVFDSSVQRGQPATFPVGGLIAGWNEALQLMKPGDQWTLYVPSDLAYGENGPPDIGANQVLIFDLQLLRVLK